jgi:drug/metabolite transporter (DMT)-like permease
MTTQRSGTPVTIVIAAACFGSLAFFAKLALRAGVHPVAFVLGRFTIAAAVLAAAGMRHRPRQPPRIVFAGVLLGLVVYAGQALTLTFALERGSASLVAVLFATYPAFVLLLLLPLRTTRRHLRPGLIVPFLGVLVGSSLLVARADAGGRDAMGIVLALSSAVLFAAFLITADALAPRLGGLALASLCCLGATVSVLVASVASDRLMFDFEAEGWLWIAAAGTIATAGAFLALFRALPHVGPATAGVILGGEPLVTVALAATFLGDRLAALQLVGAGLVVLSVSLLQYRTVVLGRGGTG